VSLRSPCIHAAALEETTFLIDAAAEGRRMPRPRGADAPGALVSILAALKERDLAHGAERAVSHATDRFDGGLMGLARSAT